MFTNTIAVARTKRAAKSGLRIVGRGLRTFFWPARLAWARSRIAVGVQPLSYAWGGDRGTPVHRLYVEHFLMKHTDDIQGKCLEFQYPLYLSKFATPRISSVDILDLESSNRHATIVADLTKHNAISNDSFDCIICTHVMHMVLDLQSLVNDLYRILKPGGVLLVAVPLVSMYDRNWGELWRFTPLGLKAVLERRFVSERIVVEAFGNSLTAAGEIRGAVAEEFSARELAWHDERFAIEVCARAVKGEQAA